MLPENEQDRTQYPSSRSVIETAKEHVPTIDLADRLCGPGQLRRVGETWAARCPLPDHTDKSPSFTVYPKNNSFYCYGCHAGGDVVALACAAWKYSKDEAPMAASDLLKEFGYEWKGWSDKRRDRFARQAPVRDAIESARFSRVQRRLFRWLYAPVIAGFEDEAERAEETSRALEECRLLAHLVIDGRRS